ncbi:TIGR02281 family clan AA aspartic protease [Jannaschia sp. LMIT008]|uniref:retropepsin-like aspartic protease family protein n=1 Tax=Jannaschia maritima TaxID=3032585 RepID=UPI002811C999|nr:TIGR02281 family clan AA aspartic protease [Jannaschia sp. LMIT008]
MSSDDGMQLVYWLLLGGVIAFGFLFANRHRMGAMVRMALTWAAIFAGVTLLVGIFLEDQSLMAPPRQAVVVDGDGGLAIEVPRSRDGHYHMVMGVEGEPVRFVVDTGATDMVLTRDDAERAGIDLESLRFSGRARTANGEVRTADVVLDEVRLGDAVDRNVRAVVNGGEMSQSLLGMSYLQTFGRIEIENDVLRLTR